MKKRYTVTDMLFNEISSDFFQTKGTLEYFLLDELGNERKVITMAELGRGKKIKTVRALYQREKPLVDALLNVEIGQALDINFSHFNKHQPTSQLVGVKKNSQFIKPTKPVVNHQDFAILIPDASRVPFLLTLVIIGTIIVFTLGIYS